MTQIYLRGRFALAKLLGNLVDLVGIEPTTSSMPWKRAPSCATGPHLRGLSYCRRCCRGKSNWRDRKTNLRS